VQQVFTKQAKKSQFHAKRPTDFVGVFFCFFFRGPLVLGRFSVTGVPKHEQNGGGGGAGVFLASEEPTTNQPRFGPPFVFVRAPWLFFCLILFFIL
jgi:hypothetical protein